MNRRSGLTLVELLIALALGVSLSAAMVATYANSRRHHFYSQELARLQENGRHALRLVTRDLAMAGFHAGIPGAALPPAPTVAVDCGAAPWALASDVPLDVVDDWAAGGVPVTVTGQPLDCIDPDNLRPGNDLLALRRVAATPAQLAGVPAPSLTSSTVLNWYLRVEDGVPLRWEQLRPRDIAAGSYAAAGVSLWPAVARIYAVQRGAEGVPQLCTETLAGNRMLARCLVEGIEHLQVEYGVDADGDGTAEQFVPAPAGTDLDRVVAARVHLLARSILPVSGHRERVGYTLGALHVPARDDGFLRRVLSQTVALDRATRRLERAD